MTHGSQDVFAWNLWNLAGSLDVLAWGQDVWILFVSLFGLFVYLTPFVDVTLCLALVLAGSLVEPVPLDVAFGPLTHSPLF